METVTEYAPHIRIVPRRLQDEMLSSKGAVTKYPRTKERLGWEHRPDADVDDLIDIITDEFIQAHTEAEAANRAAQEAAVGLF